MCYLSETHFRFKNTNSLEVNKWKKISHAIQNQKQTEVALSGRMSDKIKLKVKNWHNRQIRILYINKRVIHREDIKITKN